MAKQMRLRALAGITLVASVLLLGTSVDGTPAQAQAFNQPLVRPPSPVPNTPLSPGQQMQFQSYSNALVNRERAQENLSGGAGAGAMVRTERQPNNLQLQQLQQH
jgi:hypothetical protein